MSEFLTPEQVDERIAQSIDQVIGGDRYPRRWRAFASENRWPEMPVQPATAFTPEQEARILALRLAVTRSEALTRTDHVIAEAEAFATFLISPGRSDPRRSGIEGD